MSQLYRRGGRYGTTILARGVALQACLLAEIAGGTGVEDQHVRKAFERGSELVGIRATARTIGCHSPKLLSLEGLEVNESGG